MGGKMWYNINGELYKLNKRHDIITHNYHTVQTMKQGC